jgi:hypothetical protein
VVDFALLGINLLEKLYFALVGDIFGRGFTLEAELGGLDV